MRTLLCMHTPNWYKKWTQGKLLFKKSRTRGATPSSPRWCRSFFLSDFAYIFAVFLSFTFPPTLSACYPFVLLMTLLVVVLFFFFHTFRYSLTFSQVSFGYTFSPPSLLNCFVVVVVVVFFHRTFAIFAADIFFPPKNKVNVADEKEVEAWVQATVERYGHVDVLVNK